MLFKHNFLESKEHTLPSGLFPLGPRSFVADRGWKWVYQSAAFSLHSHSQDLGWTSFSWPCLGWEVDLLLWTLLPPFYVPAVMFLFTWLAAKLLFHPFQQRVRGLLMLSPNQPIHLFHLIIAIPPTEFVYMLKVCICEWSYIKLLYLLENRPQGIWVYECLFCIHIQLFISRYDYQKILFILRESPFLNCLHIFSLVFY